MLKKFIYYIIVCVLFLTINTIIINARGSVVVCLDCGGTAKVNVESNFLGEIETKCSHFSNGKDIFWHVEVKKTSECTECGKTRIMSFDDILEYKYCNGY